MSICLAIAGLTPIYDQFGLEGVLERLRSFLRDAKIGALMQDGWEAVPYGDLSSMCPGSIDVRFFQELAARQPGGGVAFGVARVRDKFAVLFPHHVPLAQLQAAIAAQKLEHHGKNETLWIFVWPGAPQLNATRRSFRTRPLMQMSVPVSRVSVYPTPMSRLLAKPSPPALD